MKQFLFILFLLGVVSTQAQMKQISFSNKKVNKEDIKISKVNQTSAISTSQLIPSEFHTMDGEMLDAMKSGLKPGHVNERTVPAYISGNLKQIGSRGISTENMALEYLNVAAPLMKIENPDQEFSIKNVEKDELGMTHVRMQQQANGLPVYGAEIILHGQGQNFDFLNGHYFPTIKLENVIPSKTETEAENLVNADMGESTVYTNDIKAVYKNSVPTKTLVVYMNNQEPTLVYHIVAFKNMIDRWEYFVDAHSGEIIHKFQSICKFHNHINGESCGHNHDATVESTLEENVLLDGKTTATAQDLFNVNRSLNTYQVGSKYYLIDGARDIFSSTPANLPNDPNGVIWTIDAFNTSPSKSNFNYDHVSSTNNTWSNKTSVSAHYNGGQAFEYYRNVHNRKSINGTGGNIISLINVADDDGSSMGNAYWNGEAMFYGNGDSAFLPLARGLDVAGHEMTHGVVQSTANLEYQGEAGALNESFADVFGSMIDRDDWLIGEDVVKTASFPSGALRSLSDPHNGASTNNFNAGWQPKTYSERYKGSEDNGGVHLNSGIPNHAFYLFATAIGKDKAEKVYYRTLANYLTKSSQFVDCRIAVIKAATDLYGATEIAAAKSAFDQVGILGESGGNYETNVEVNPGQEYVLVVNANGNGIFIHDTNGNSLGQISSTSVISKPSVSDNGSEIVFVGSDEKIHYIYLDWSKPTIIPQEDIIGASPIWRNAIISKDGFLIAALTNDKVPEINVFNFYVNPATIKTFPLYNPTYSTGVVTGDVDFADAMEFDVTGEYIMYDAENAIKSTNSGSINYWDISFINVWNAGAKSFSDGKIEKLFSSLPNDVSIGNPTFSKNSPYIVAFDYIDADGANSLLASNVETGTTNLIYENNALSYPNYSSKDNKIVFEYEGNSGLNLAVNTLKTSKIEPAADPTVFTNGRRWAVWFSNGNRNLSGSNDIIPNAKNISLLSNPVTDELNLLIELDSNNEALVKITDVSGKVFNQFNTSLVSGQNKINTKVDQLVKGSYFISVIINNQVQTLKFIKS